MKVGEYMTIETNDNLNQLIKAYNHDIELNRLKDILDYLKSKPIYMPSTINMLSITNELSLLGLIIIAFFSLNLFINIKQS